MKWSYKKEYRYESETFRIAIETAYHIDEKKNVTFICEQELRDNEWHNVSVNRFYTKVR